MVDPKDIKAFWEKRAVDYSGMAFETIGNLEPDKELLDLKIKLETECVLPRLPLGQEPRVLDLGGGCGQWAFRFAGYVKEVVVVEYSSSMVKVGREEVTRRAIRNVTFVEQSAEKFTSNEPFDIVFISGLMVYLTDQQALALLKNLPALVKSDGIVFLRDGTSILPERYTIENRYSEVLKTNYSAIYRTREEYVTLYGKAGFSLRECGQFFEEGCPLNKYPETRLHYFIFQKK